MTNKDYSSDQRYDKELDEALKNLIANARNTDMASGFLADEAKAKLSALLRRVEVDTLNAVSSHFDDLHQGTPGAGWVHYGEMGEWLDDRIKELEAEL